MNTSPGLRLPGWAPSLARVVALVSAAVCLYSMRQADPDLWGYLSYGRLFVEQHGLVAHDPFAYTSGASRWFTFEYGAHVLLWLAFSWGGAAGLIALKCALGGAALYGAHQAIRATSDEPFVWVPMFLLCTSAVSRFFLFRPQLFTFAFFGLFVAVLFRFLLRRPAPLWALPLAMVVWTNTHGGFVAGLGAVGLTILLRASENITPRNLSLRRIFSGTAPLWMTLAGCALVTLVNPLGPNLWIYVLKELTHGTNRRYIAEWSPASLSNDPWSLIVLTLLAAIVIVVGLAAHRRRVVAGPAALAWAASAVPLIVMSYQSVRHVPLAAIWAAPVITLLASRLNEDLTSLVTFRRAWFLLRGFALLPVCLTFAVVYAEPQPVIRAAGGVLGRTHPCRAVNFLRQNAIRGNLYNPLWWGSYITWEQYPWIRVSMDGRNISLYPEEMVVENLKFYSYDAGEADIEAPLRYDTDMLLVPTDRPVLARVRADRRWHEIYSDKDAAIFLRADAPPTSAAATLAGRSFVAPTDRCPTTLH